MKIKSDPFKTEYLFFNCQIGSEPALKKELSLKYSFLRLSYSRPGFLTFKGPSEKLTLDLKLDLIFAQSYGLCLGRTQRAELTGRLRKLELNKKVRVHSWLAPLKKIDPKAKTETLPRNSELEIECYDNPLAQEGEIVLSLIFLPKDEIWIGAHRHSAPHLSYPGGLFTETPPPQAPSRAYLKIKEAVLWTGTQLRSSDLAIEIGSAPGGASYFLLSQGLRVIGIDPGEMAESVLHFDKNQFMHIRESVTQIALDPLPKNADWILLDMNVRPEKALLSAERLVKYYKNSILGVFLTLKLNEWELVDQIPEWKKRIQRLDLRHVQARQLSTNAREICLAGFTHAGLTRLRKI